eukprot:gene5710-7881_t
MTFFLKTAIILILISICNTTSIISDSRSSSPILVGNIWQDIRKVIPLKIIRRPLFHQILFKETLTTLFYSPIVKSTAMPSQTSLLRYEKRTSLDFASRESRVQFVRQAHSIFGAQQLLIVIFTAFIVFNTDLAQFISNNFKLLTASALLGSGTAASVLVINPDIRNKLPVNIVLVCVYTFLQAILVGVVTTLLNSRMVCLGTIHTLVSYLALTISSYQPTSFSYFKLYDCLSLRGVFTICLITSLVVGLFLSIFFGMPLKDNIISSLISIGLHCSIMNDNISITEGKHRTHNYGAKEYILAGISPYPDIWLMNADRFSYTKALENDI